MLTFSIFINDCSTTGLCLLIQPDKTTSWARQQQAERQHRTKQKHPPTPAIMPHQMLRHRPQTQGKEPSAPVNWKLCITNQTSANNHQREACEEKPEPRRTAQPDEEHQDQRRKKSDNDNGQESPMLEERQHTVILASMIHTFQTLLRRTAIFKKLLAPNPQ